MTVIRRSTTVTASALLPPAQLARVFAQAARQIRDDAIAAGDAPKRFATFVDGRAGAAEESVRTDGTGTILYKFSALADAAAFALAYVQARSPVDSGAYRNAWLVAVDGRKWPGALTDIPAGAEVMIVNPEPYARKIDVGGMKMSVPPQIVENARQAVKSAYPAVRAERAFVNLPPSLSAGINYPVPWILQPRGKRSGFIRRDNRAGMPITYPALILKAQT